jgi:hypothetical protein
MRQEEEKPEQDKMSLASNIQLKIQKAVLNISDNLE